KLEAFFSVWEFKARHHLTASDAQSLTVGELLALAAPRDREAFEQTPLTYTETWGASDLRTEIAATYDSLDAAHILGFAGAEEGLYTAMHALLGPADHAIVLTPNYQSAESIPLSLCAVTGVPLDPDDHWSLDLDRLRAALRPNTKLVSVNFPHNPTGKILEPEKFSALVGLCRERGLWLFSDEVYRLIEHAPARRLPQAADLYERGISLNVLSKAYGLPGLRVGWIACRDQALLQKMERIKHYLSICNSAPSERLAVIALRAREKILRRNRDLATRNLAALDQFFGEFPALFDWRRPDGGVVAYPRYLGADGVEEFTRRLVEESGVLLLPASIYQSALGPTPTDHFRIGFVRANLDAGLAALRRHLQTTRDRTVGGALRPED
ncbi:MAG: aminotransferase class I/II-fold pyridoxal phosphate-dependent enzyme, partial [Opitutae bacterium]|nr:aminotransferase class I/II-fold pyridoxal phosphate-dependent enzyme [Opitutae bacterium]